MLETFTHSPNDVTPERIAQVMALGVSREAIRDAFHVAFLFNVYDRLADTLGWELPDERYYRKAATFLLSKGYR